MLSDDGDAAVVDDPRVDDHAIAESEVFDTVAESSDDAGSVRSQDSRLRNGRQTLAYPDIQMIET